MKRLLLALAVSMFTSTMLTLLIQPNGAGARLLIGFLSGIFAMKISQANNEI